nr:hypothetical protein [Tanacetum cinerariifolium]
MVKNLDNVNKFLMYPRFVQVFLYKQLEEMSNHNKIYVTPSHTKKIFENIRRVGKGFSGRETSLFPTMMVQAQEEMGEGSAIPSNPQHTPTILQPSTSQQQKTQKHRKPRRKVTEVPQPSDSIENIANEAVYKELNDSLVKAMITASSLEVEQDSGNINKTQSKATPNESSSQGTDSGGCPRGNTLQSDEDTLKLNELIELCTVLQLRVLDLEKTKTTQALEIDSLKRRVKKLKRLYKVDDEQMFDVNDLQGEEVCVQEDVFDKEVTNKVQKVVEEEVKDINTTKLIVNAAQVNAVGKVNVASIAITDSAAAIMTVDEVTLAQALMEIIDEVTLAQALMEIKSTKPKAKGIVL